MAGIGLVEHSIFEFMEPKIGATANDEIGRCARDLAQIKIVYLLKLPKLGQDGLGRHGYCVRLVRIKCPGTPRSYLI